MKRFVILLAAALSVGSSAHAANIGDVAGDFYFTDIKTYFCHMPVIAYNIGGRTCIDAESLGGGYGFEVEWKPEARELDIYDAGENAAADVKSGREDEEHGVTGTPAGKYYFTDIKAILNGEEIESYNIGGRTCIAAENMRDFGYDVDWDSQARTLSISRPQDFYKIETDFGTIATKNNYSRGTRTLGSRFGARTMNIQVSAKDAAEWKQIKADKSRIIYTASGVGYAPLSQICSAVGAGCSMSREEKTAHIEFADGTGFDEPYCAYRFDITYQPENVQLEDCTAGDEMEVIEPGDYYYISCDDVSVYVNGEEVRLGYKYASRNGEVNFYDTGMAVIDSVIYVPLDFALNFLDGYYWVR